jgi:hypothetical protein
VTGPAPINQGTCEAWCDAEQILACCGQEFGTDTDLEAAAEIASDLLFRITGRQYPGICEATVRPCASNQSCWSRWPEWHARDCSCRTLSKIRLAGYPVREILEVSIDGEIVDPADYRLDRNRELVRLNGGRWPACQRLDLDEGIGTFFVIYDYGLEPPVGGSSAAAQLACEIAKACPGSGLEDDCALPPGTIRVVRQDITIDVQSFGLWLLGTIKTGLPLLDAFLSVHAQAPHRRTALSVPEMDPWPLRLAQ